MTFYKKNLRTKIDPLTEKREIKVTQKYKIFAKIAKLKRREICAHVSRTTSKCF